MSNFKTAPTPLPVLNDILNAFFVMALLIDKERFSAGWHDMIASKILILGLSTVLAISGYALAGHPLRTYVPNNKQAAHM